MLDFGFYNLDCMVGMKEFPDKYFDLAIVDPPYGVGQHFNFRFGVGDAVYENKAPKQDFFDELFRISKHSIIWGGNYFELPIERGWISWYKGQPIDDYSDFELAWTNFDRTAKQFNLESYGFRHADKRRGEKTIHPTQKPVQLYQWLLQNYAKPGDKIIDTHVGSASSLIAFEKEGFDYVGFELDEDYFRDANKRLKQARITTIDMFKEPKIRGLKQENLF